MGASTDREFFHLYAARHGSFADLKAGGPIYQHDTGPRKGGSGSQPVLATRNCKKKKTEGKGEALADETNRRRRAKCTGRINLIVPHGPKEADDRSTQAQTLIHARRYGREQIRARRGGEGGGEEEGEGNGALAWGGGGGRWRRRGPRAPGPGRRAAAARPPPPSSGRRRPPRSLGRLCCWVCFPFPRPPRLAHCGSGLPAFRA
jgi:hypothetical protein